MARHKSEWVIRAEYYPLRWLLFLLQVLPLAWSQWLSSVLIRGILTLMPKRRQLIENQLLLCFPDYSPRQRATTIRHFVNYLAQGLSTFARIPSMDTKAMKAMVETVGFEHIEDAFRKGKGMITFTAHYGCWELMAIYVTHFYPEIAMVVRPLDNPLVDQLVTQVRSSGGGGVIDSRKVLKEGMRLLRRNGILGVLIDQNFYKGGVFVNFFGRPAATNTLVPILARRTECAVLPMHNVWKNGKIQIICEAPISLSRNPDQNAAILEDTQTLTKVVEGWIREDPSQWLWLHNRWKRQPTPDDPIAH